MTRIPSSPTVPGLRLAAVALLAAGLGCGEPAPPPHEPFYNVILISIDTLRSDHLGAYGYDRPTSPRVDSFAAEAVVFEQAIAQAPSTLHSHASMLSSLLPQHHRASWGAGTGLDDAALTLAEVLRDNGYRTAALSGGGQMADDFGLNQGFDFWDEPEVEHFAGTVRHGIEWMDENGDAPFFLLLHSYEVHHPYQPREPYREMLVTDYDGELPETIGKETLDEINKGGREIDQADLDYIVSLYDAEIRSMDDGFGALVDYLRERGLYDRTLIVFTSDHGEEFNEHGTVGWHSHTLYDELLRVPLIVKYPGNEHSGSSVAPQVRSIDIPPTVVGYLGIPIPAEFFGVDLAPLVTGEAMEPLVAISRMDRKPTRELSSIRTEEWKLAGLAKRRSLYHLPSDPAEQWDRRLKDGEVATELAARLDALIAERQPLEAPEVVPEGKTLQELRNLGYLND